jgi:hypothetical protein
MQPAINKSMESIFGVPPSSFDQPAVLATPQDIGGNVLKELLRGPLSAVGYKEVVTPALKLARERATHSALTPEQDVRYGLRKKILEAAKTSPGQAQAMTNIAVNRGTLTNLDVKALARKQGQPDPLLNALDRLDAKNALDVFRLATFREKRNIYGEVKNKIEKSGTLTPVMKSVYLSRLDHLAGSARQ